MFRGTFPPPRECIACARVALCAELRAMKTAAGEDTYPCTALGCDVRRAMAADSDAKSLSKHAQLNIRSFWSKLLV